MNNKSQDYVVDTKQNLQQQPAAQQKDVRTEAPKPNMPKSNVPEYGDKPEQVTQAEGRGKKRQKSII